MRPTKYNKRITVQQSEDQTEGETGGRTDDWTDLFTCWAKVIPMPGTKKLIYGETQYNEAYEVEMRKRDTNIDADCRVVYDSNNYQVRNFEIHDNYVKVDITR